MRAAQVLVAESPWPVQSEALASVSATLEVRPFQGPYLIMLGFDPIQVMRDAARQGRARFPATKNGDAVIALLDNEPNAALKSELDLSQKISHSPEKGVVRGEIQESVLAVLSGKWMLTSEVARKCGRASEQASAALSNLFSRGRIERVYKDRALRWRKKSTS